MQNFRPDLDLKQEKEIILVVFESDMRIDYKRYAFFYCVFLTHISPFYLFYQEIHLKIALCKIHSYVLWVMTSTCNDRCNTKRPIKVTGNIYKEHIRVIVVILYSVSYG